MRLKATIDWILAGYVVIALMLVALLASAAPPSGADLSSPLAAWFRSLQNSKGEYCCNVADCRRPYAWREDGQGYSVQPVAGSPWLIVPADNILHVNNPVGDAVACIVGGEVRCFVPPVEG